MSVKKLLQESGFSFIVDGSEVIVCVAPDKKFVVKDTTQAGPIEFAKYCVARKNNSLPRTQYGPGTESPYAVPGLHVTCIRTEHLESVIGDDAIALNEWMTRAELALKADDYSSLEDHKGLKDIYAELHQEAVQRGLGWDLGADKVKNVMCRQDGVLVIIDPWNAPPGKTYHSSYLDGELQ